MTQDLAKLPVEYFEIVEWLTDHAGLKLSSLGLPRVRRAIDRHFDQSSATSLQWLACALREDPSEARGLIERLIVPETWFLRDPVAFAWLETWARQQLRKRISRPNRRSGLLRVLCSACASGEEPYSVAMTLLEVGWHADEVEILAIDLSHDQIEQARHGQYRPIDLRLVDEPRRQRWFQRQDSGDYRVRDSLRRFVSFHQANLTDPQLWSRTAETFDLVLCRNVLLYLSDRARCQTLLAISMALKPDGCLMIGHADPYPQLDEAFVRVGPAGAFAFGKRRKRPLGEFQAEVADVGEKTATSWLEDHRHPVVTRRTSQEARCDRKIKPSAGHDTTPERRWAQAHRWADAGQYRLAERACLEALDQDGPTADGYLLLGYVHRGLAEIEKADEAMRRALVLDPTRLEALLALADSAQRRGDDRSRQDYLRRAERLRFRREGSDS